MDSGDRSGAQDVQSGRLTPRLLDLMASSYLSLSERAVLGLEEAGVIRRARIVVKGREVRKRLYDREQLDRLVDGWTA
jgi:hypothetical protein